MLSTSSRTMHGPCSDWSRTAGVILLPMNLRSFDGGRRATLVLDKIRVARLLVPNRQCWPSDKPRYRRIEDAILPSFLRIYMPISALRRFSFGPIGLYFPVIPPHAPPSRHQHPCGSLSCLVPFGARNILQLHRIAGL